MGRTLLASGPDLGRGKSRKEHSPLTTFMQDERQVCVHASAQTQANLSPEMVRLED